MALVDDYKCTDESCNHVQEYSKPYGEDFPKEIPCEICGKASKKSLTGGNIIIPNCFKSC